MCVILGYLFTPKKVYSFHGIINKGCFTLYYVRVTLELFVLSVPKSLLPL